MITFILCAARGAVPVDTTKMKLFGHSIKNGHLVANTEIPLFEHTCSTPPCTITQLHCPTAGPGGWYDAVVSLFIDDDPPLSFTLLELANIGNPTNIPGSNSTPPAPTPAVAPVYSEYFLGVEGASCDATCAAQSPPLRCTPSVNTGFALDGGAKMRARLAAFNASITNCTMGAHGKSGAQANKWWAPDQPNYVCGNDGNGNSGHCVGWDDIPTADLCSASFPTACRVCHCVAGSESGAAVRGAAAPPAPGTSDGGPWGTAAFGHTAHDGGVYR